MLVVLRKVDWLLNLEKRRKKFRKYYNKPLIPYVQCTLSKERCYLWGICQGFEEQLPQSSAGPAQH